MVHPRLGENNALKFQGQLYLFWRPEKIAKWKAEFYNDADGPQKATDSCRNIIYFADDIHEMWRRDLFAMRPIGYNDEVIELEVEFHWMACQGHRLRESVPITKTPTTPAGLDSTVGIEGTPYRIWFNYPGGHKWIKTGDRFIISTESPETHPLPSIELLGLQFHLQRLAAMSAAGADDNLEYVDHEPLSSSCPAALLSSSQSTNAMMLQQDRFSSLISATATKIRAMMRVALPKHQSPVLFPSRRAADGNDPPSSLAKSQRAGDLELDQSQPIWFPEIALVDATRPSRTWRKEELLFKMGIVLGPRMSTQHQAVRTLKTAAIVSHPAQQCQRVLICTRKVVVAH